MRFVSAVPRGEWTDLVFEADSGSGQVTPPGAEGAQEAARQHAIEMNRQFVEMQRQLAHDEVSKRRIQSQIDRMLPEHRDELRRQALEKIGHRLTNEALIQAMMRHIIAEDHDAANIGHRSQSS
jgi:hypothetical protein